MTKVTIKHTKLKPTPRRITAEVVTEEEVTITFDEETLEKLDNYCKIDKCSRTEFIKGAVLGYLIDRDLADIPDSDTSDKE